MNALSPARLLGMRRGIEKESLRAQPDGRLALTPHPAVLGSALTHPHITTDFSESQVELITGAHTEVEACLDELARIIPSRDTRILIYCNNNFLNERAAFPSKLPAASLNVHTFNVLFAYGYRNVYELGPLIDIEKTRIVFEGTAR